MSVCCLPFPCFNQCKQYLMTQTFRNTPLSQGRSCPELLHSPEQKFFGIITHNVRPATASILGMQGWAASSQGSLPASYRLYNQGRIQHVLPGQQLPFIQQMLKLGRGLSQPHFGNPRVRASLSMLCLFTLPGFPPGLPPGHSTATRLQHDCPPAAAAALGLSYPRTSCPKSAPFSRPGSRGIATGAWVTLFE